MDKEYIKAKLANLPHAPGSYQMKDANGEIIYVGKAKDLHNRVNSYFTGVHNFKTTKLVQNIEDFDFIVTASEKEALVLEINLIKKNRPKYNIQFMDDSSYPYIKMTREKYPRLMIARDMKKDRKARYFGPFPDASAARVTLRLLQSMYPFRRCNSLGDKVCLYYHIGQCLGPCEYEVDTSVYEQMAEQITRFLKGDTGQIEKELSEKMMAAADELNFEAAQQYKETLESIRRVAGERQNIEKVNEKDIDVFTWCADRGYLAIAGMLVRNGIILNKEYRLKPLYGEGQEEFQSFLIQYYEDHPCPKDLVLPQGTDLEILSGLFDVNLIIPQKGYRKKLMDMAEENAKTQLEMKFSVVEKQDTIRAESVEELSRIAGRSMNRVELFDNSHIQGAFPVSSCVVYEDGEPVRKDYRLYRLHTGNSDVDSMKEVIYRRYFRLMSEGGRMPDGIIVDGGRTQIDAANEIITSLGLNDQITIMGLVKNDKHNTDGLMDVNGNIAEIDRKSGLFFLLTRMQDEVHRTAITYHRKLRSKAQTKSILDEIEGVGPKRKKQLLKVFGGIGKLKEASIDEIAKEVPRQVAENIYRVLHEEDN